MLLMFNKNPTNTRCSRIRAETLETFAEALAVTLPKASDATATTGAENTGCSLGLGAARPLQASPLRRDAEMSGSEAETIRKCRQFSARLYSPALHLRRFHEPLRSESA